MAPTGWRTTPTSPNPLDRSRARHPPNSTRRGPRSALNSGSASCSSPSSVCALKTTPRQPPASTSRKRHTRGATGAGARGVPATPASRDRGKDRPRDQRSPRTGSCLSLRGLPRRSRTKRGGEPPRDSRAQHRGVGGGTRKPSCVLSARSRRSLLWLAPRCLSGSSNNPHRTGPRARAGAPLLQAASITSILTPLQTFTSERSFAASRPASARHIQHAKRKPGKGRPGHAPASQTDHGTAGDTTASTNNVATATAAASNNPASTSTSTSSPTTNTGTPVTQPVATQTPAPAASTESSPPASTGSSPSSSASSTSHSTSQSSTPAKQPAFGAQRILGPGSSPDS